jgi:hypothetical protein
VHGLIYQLFGFLQYKFCKFSPVNNSDIIREISAITDTRECSILCDATSNCKSFATIPSNSSCIMLSNVPNATSTGGDVEAYVPFPQHHFISLGTNRKTLSAPSFVNFPTVTDLTFCLRICEIFENCSAVAIDPCSLYKGENYDLDSTQTNHPEIWISYLQQTKYTSDNVKFIVLENHAFAGLPEEKAWVTTSFPSVGASRLLVDGSVFIWDISFDDNSNLITENSLHTNVLPMCCVVDCCCFLY